jgi:hypothetical protein
MIAIMKQSVRPGVIIIHAIITVIALIKSAGMNMYVMTIMNIAQIRWSNYEQLDICK